MHKFFAKPLFLAKNVIFLPQCHSTNDFAQNEAKKADIQEGTLYVTQNQTSGKGQRGNVWISEPRKNITCTLVLKPKFLKVKDQFMLTMAIALGVNKFLQQYLPLAVVKWPNDLYIEDHKIGGMLIENTIQREFIEYAFVGIGLNINQQAFHLPSATSLSIQTGQQFDLESLLEQLIVAIEVQYLKLKQQPQSLKRAYLSVLYRYEEWATYEDSEGPFEGKILGVDTFGRLILLTSKGQKAYNIQEVSFIS